MTYGEQLDSVQKAISLIETGAIASYKVGEQEINRANIKVLYAERKYLIEQIKILGASYDPSNAVYFNGKVKIGFR